MPGARRRLIPLDPPRLPAAGPAGELGFGRPVVPSIDAQLNDPDPAGRERLDEIAASTLVIGGARSHIDQSQLARTVREIPAGRFVSIDAGHLVHADCPDEFLAALRLFGIG